MLLQQLQLLTQADFPLNLMISKAYEKADFTVEIFELEDVITVSTVVPTTTAPATTTTTLPGVTSGSAGDANIYFDYSDFFQ